MKTITVGDYIESIYLHQPVNTADIQRFLSGLFPALSIHYSHIYEEPDVAPETYADDDPTNVVFFVDEDKEKLEFGFRISIVRMGTSYSQERVLYIGRRLSQSFKIPVLVPFVHPEDPNSPDYDIIFKDGKSYLADDSNTNFADGTEAHIRILALYPLPDYSFDNYGNPQQLQA